MTDDYPEAIFYDSKTTIFDWKDQWDGATNDILRKYDLDIEPGAFQNRWLQYMAGGFLTAAFTEYRNLDPCIRDALVSTYSYYDIDGDPDDVEFFIDRYDEVEPFPEADEALARQQEYTKVMTFSNVESEYFRMMVDKLDMEPDFVGTMEDAGYIKPSPYAYRWVLDQMDLEPEETLYCAAPVWDVNGAMAFGVKAAYLNREHQEWQEPQREPHYVISDLAELADMLEDGEIAAPERTEVGRPAE